MRHKRWWLYVLIVLIASFFWQRASIVSFALTKYLNYPIKLGSLSWSPQDKRIAVADFELGVNVASKNCHLSFDMPKFKEDDIGLHNIQLRLGQVLIDADLQVHKQAKQQVLIRALGSSKRGPIKDLLACVDLQQDDLLAEFELPKFEINLRLEQGNVVQDSITGSGEIILYNGKFKLIDIVKPVICKFACKDEQANLESSKSFDILTAEFRIADQFIQVKNIKFKNFYTKAKGKGRIGFDSSINFDLYLAGLDSYLPIEQLKLDYLLPQGLMPIKIIGTVGKPLVFPNPTSLPQSLKPGFLDKIFELFKKKGLCSRFFNLIIYIILKYDPVFKDLALLTLHPGFC